MKDKIHRSAVLSPCGLFRYELRRKWKLDEMPRRQINFVMLNPSTADANIDDPTIRRCMGFADRLGFNELRVVNLFAFRATSPRDLAAKGYPIGPQNDYFTGDVGDDSNCDGEPVVLAWGANARGLSAPNVLIGRLRSRGAHMFALRTLADGTPAHPLMLPYSCVLTPWNK